jgi:DNA-binding transcriptional LysR family regulator
MPDPASSPSWNLDLDAIVGETDNIESLKRMVEAGLGLTLLSRLVVESRSDWRAALLPIREDAHREVVLLHRGREHLSPAADALRKVLIEYARRYRGTSSRD